MKKILCPTDFSETAQTATAYAAKLAQALDADLTLMNVQSLFDYTPAEIIRGKEMTIAAAAERLESESRQISKAFKISCYSLVEPSHRKLSTIITQRSKQFDLIVMGSDGPDDLYQFFTGSNTYNAVKKSQTPLLLVPAGYTYSEISKVVYAYDYLHNQTLPLTGLFPIIKQLNASLTVLQVLPEDFTEKEENEIVRQQEAISNFYNEISIQYETIHSEEVATSINSFVLRSEPDLLALYSGHRNLVSRLFHKSIVKNITAFCSYPVFVFHG